MEPTDTSNAALDVVVAGSLMVMTSSLLSRVKRSYVRFRSSGTISFGVIGGKK